MDYRSIIVNQSIFQNWREEDQRPFSVEEKRGNQISIHDKYKLNRPPENLFIAPSCSLGLAVPRLSRVAAADRTGYARDHTRSDEHPKYQLVSVKNNVNKKKDNIALLEQSHLGVRFEKKTVHAATWSHFSNFRSYISNVKYQPLKARSDFEGNI